MVALSTQIELISACSIVLTARSIVLIALPIVLSAEPTKILFRVRPTLSKRNDVIELKKPRRVTPAASFFVGGAAGFSLWSFAYRNISRPKFHFRRRK
jgi:hypothetical protein